MKTNTPFSYKHFAEIPHADGIDMTGSSVCPILVRCRPTNADMVLGCILA